MLAEDPFEEPDGAGGCEVKRRTRAVGIFPNVGPIVRLVSLMMLETNDGLGPVRRYMSPESLEETFRRG